MTQSESLQAARVVEELVRGSIEGQRFGTVEVRDLLASLGEDADGETAVYVVLELSDPQGPTWPFDDVQKLRRRIREVLVANPPGLPFYVQFRPETEEPQEDEDVELGSI